FSLYCPPAIPVLHSFPTRRSSDLDTGNNGRAGWGFRRSGRQSAGGTAARRRISTDRVRAPATRSRGGKSPPPSPCRRAGGLRTLDRKSTRLNSSHVAISYAVFCLK